MAEEIVTRAEARAKGLTRYFTGKPCKNGHIAERVTANGGCIICNYAAETRHRETHREKFRDKWREYEQNASEKRIERRRAARKKWEDAHPGHSIERSAKWKKENPERAAENERKWRAANPEKIAEKNKRYKTTHADRLRPINIARARQWAKDNPEKMREHSRFSTARRRTRILENGGSFTYEEALALLERQNGKCTCCGDALDETRELDHIHPVARGGTSDISNLQWLCRPCNRRKSAKVA